VAPMHPIKGARGEHGPVHAGECGQVGVDLHSPAKVGRNFGMRGNTAMGPRVKG
jgi:hypothetical protein